MRFNKYEGSCLPAGSGEPPPSGHTRVFFSPPRGRLGKRLPAPVSLSPGWGRGRQVPQHKEAGPLEKAPSERTC